MADDALLARERELAGLERRLADARSGSGCVVLIQGDPGVGKTSLAHALVQRARQSGLRTAWGACLEGEGAGPYRPWLQVLGSLQHAASQLTDPAAGDPGSRSRLFTDVAEALRTAAGDDGLVIVVDDLHWADVPSIRLLQFLAAEVAESRLMVLGLYRGGEAFGHADLAGALPNILRERAAGMLRLGGLTPAGVEALIGHELQQPPGEELLRAINERAEGNPLFVLELVRLATVSGRIDDELPHRIREVIGRRLDGLPTTARRALRQASVLGREFSVSLLADVLDDGVDVLDSAIAAHVVHFVSSTALRFDHALIQEVAYAELPATERQRLHDRAARAIDMAHGDVDALAFHLRQAVPLGRAAEALDATLRAAERARSQLAYEHAAYHYRAALDLLPLVPGTPVRAPDLLLDAARCEFRSGAVEEAWRICRAAADLGRADGDAATLADAATVLRGIANSSVTGEIHGLCREALAMLDGTDQVREARVVAQLAVTADPFADVEPGLGQRALLAAEASGDSDAVFLALQARRTELTDIRCSVERLTLGERAIRLGREIGNDEYAAWGHMWRMDAFWELSRRIQLDAETAALASLVDRMNEPLWLWRLTMARACVALEEGRFAEARRLADQAMVIGRRGGHEGAGFLHLVFRDHLSALTGTGRDEVEKEVRELVTEGPFLMRDWLANVLADLGRIDEAAELWRTIVPHLDEFPRRAREWIIAHCGNADMCVHLGDTDTASTLYDDLLPFESLQATAGAETPSRGPVALYLGKLAVLSEQWDAAEAHLRTALELSTAMGARPHRAKIHLEIGRLLLARRRGRDVRTAKSHLATALGMARDLGMRRVERAAAALLGQGSDDAGPLTPREHEVAALVADGLSNRQIARRLHLSERTAENHVTNILNKLGFDSRARIAAWFAAQPSRAAHRD